MTEQSLFPIAVQPVISYPREAEVGKTYLMTIDLQVVEGSEWQFEEEEYPIYCIVESEPLFKCKALGESAIVLHRFGGSYGAAKFLLTAMHQQTKGEIKVALVNSWGVPTKSIGLAVSNISKLLDSNITLANNLLSSKQQSKLEKYFENTFESTIEQYLRGDVSANYRLINDPMLQNVIRRIAAKISRIDLREDAIQEAFVRLSVVIREHKFTRAFFLRCLKVLGCTVVRQKDLDLDEIITLSAPYAQYTGMLLDRRIFLCFSHKSPSQSDPSVVLIQPGHEFLNTTLDLIAQLHPNESSTIPDIAFRAWSARVAQNSIIDFLRRQRRIDISETSLDTVTDIFYSVDEVPIYKDYVYIFLGVAEELDQKYPQRNYSILLQAIISEKTQKQIAHEMGITLTEVSKRRKELAIHTSIALGVLDEDEAKEALLSIRRRSSIKRLKTDY